jgi:hypothetical protein
MKGRISATVAIYSIVALFCSSFISICQASTADPFLEQGLRPAVCIVTDRHTESYGAVRAALVRRGARALHEFPPAAIFGRFPDDLTEGSLAPLPVSIARSPDAIASAGLNPITHRALRRLFDERGFLESAHPVPPGPIRDIIITEPAEIRGGAVRRGPQRGSPMEITERGFRQNSEFMIGSVLINIVFPESAGGSEEWTDDEIAEAVSGIALGVTEYQRKANWVDLDFTYNYEEYIRIPISMEPIEVGNWKSTDSLWIREAMDYLGHGDEDTYWLKVHALNNETRARFGTDWVLTAFIIDSSEQYPGCWMNAFYTAYAGFGGPFLVVPHPACDYGYGVGFAGVFIHEMSHNFYALDEYEGGQPCADRAGYLDVQNRNALQDSCQKTVPCIMRADLMSTPFAVCEYTMGQIGLADKEMNAVPDIFEVVPSIEFIDIPGVTADTITSDSYLMAVRFRNEARPNMNPYQQENFPDRMIDYAPWLAGGWYVVNNGAIRELNPSDGVWDGSREDVGFFSEELDPGMNTITVHVENCVGLWSEAETEVCYVGIKYYQISGDVAEEYIDIGWKTAEEVFGAEFDVVREDKTGGGGEAVIATVDSCVSSGGGYKYFVHRDETVMPGHEYRYYILAHFELGVCDSVQSFRIPSEDMYKTAMLPVVSGLVSNLLPNPTSGRTSFTVDIPRSFNGSAGRVSPAGEDRERRSSGGMLNAPALTEVMTHVDITVYDVTGRRVATIYSRRRFGGLKTFAWDGLSQGGQPVPPGVYFIRVIAGDETAVRKVIVIR